jgi:hypothetical protein
MGFIGRRPRVPSARAVAGIPQRARPWPRGDIQGGARLVLSHSARASAGGRKAEEKEEEVADGWGPHGSEQSKGGVGGS